MDSRYTRDAAHGAGKAYHATWSTRYERVLNCKFPHPSFYHHLTFYKKISEDIERVLHDRDDAKRGGKRSIFYELRDNPTLPPSEKSSLRLEHEGTLLVMAGIKRNTLR